MECEGVLSTNVHTQRRRPHRSRSAGKPRTWRRGPGDCRGSGLITALCSMKFGPTGNGAAVNATNLTRPVVTLEAEVANPWRAGCLETCTSGSEGGVGKHRSAVRLAPTLQQIATYGEVYPCLSLPNGAVSVWKGTPWVLFPPRCGQSAKGRKRVARTDLIYPGPTEEPAIAGRGW
jgi:hypothetical protein